MGGDWIYFNDRNDGFHIYKVKVDGSEKQMVSEDKANSLNLVGDWIYYCIREEGIYRIKTDGANRGKVTDDWSYDISVVGDWMYYANEVGGEPFPTPDGYESQAGIYKIKTDGSERQRVNKDGSYPMQVAGDWVYYIGAEYNIYKMKTDGSEKQQVNEDNTWYFNVVEERIYYMNRGINGRGTGVYRINTDGTDRQMLTEDFGVSLNVAGDWLYFQGNGEYILTRVKTDGSEKQYVDR